MRGDFAPGSTIDIKFRTCRQDGSPATLSGTPAIAAYKSNSITQSTAGITLTVDFDGITGLNHVRVDTSASGAFYAAGADFDLVITQGTVDGVSVAGSLVGEFSVANRPVLAVDADEDLRDALGLAVANLDEQLTGIDDAVDAEIQDLLDRIGTPAGVSLSADIAAAKAQIAAIETDTQDLQSRVPAALVGGRMDVSVGAIAAGAITAAATAADYVAELQSGLATSSEVGTVAVSLGEVLDAVGDILEDTGTTLPAVLGSPATGSLAGDLAVVESQTDDLGTAGAGLTAVPWNPAWAAQISAVLAGYDVPTKAELDAAVAPLALEATSEAVGNAVAAVAAAVAALNDLSQEEIRAAVGLTEADLDDQIAAIPEAILGKVSGVETGYSLRAVLRVLLAIGLGQASGLRGPSAAFRSPDGAKVRVQAALDPETGSRGVATVDVT